MEGGHHPIVGRPLTKVPRRAAHLVNDVSLHMGVVILHVLSALELWNTIAAVVAKSCREILDSYTYYTNDSMRGRVCVWGEG